MMIRVIPTRNDTDSDSDDDGAHEVIYRFGMRHGDAGVRIYICNVLYTY